MIPRSAFKAIRKIFSGSKGVAVPDFSDISDHRKKRGVRFTLNYLLEMMFCAMLAGFLSLQSLEAFTSRRGKRVSDTNFYKILCELHSAPFREKMYKQVYTLYRAKCLEPIGLPCHVVAIDNKTLYYGEEKISDDCQKTHDPHTKEVRYHLRTVGAILTSNPIMPMLDRIVTPPETNDMGIFPKFFNNLRNQYGEGLLQNPISTLDSGFCSLKNANLIDGSGWGYVFSLKGIQGSLLQEAQRLFSTIKLLESEYTTSWQSYQGKLIRWKLYRTCDMTAWETDGGVWTHLRQVWLVITEELQQLGKKKKGRYSKRLKPIWSEPQIVEERYFITNVLWNYLTPEQILRIIRDHWWIENGAHWTFDVIWKEDHAPWCRKNEALILLAILRAMAVTMLRWIKLRHLRNDTVQHMGWKELLEWIKEIMAGVIVVIQPIALRL